MAGNPTLAAAFLASTIALGNTSAQPVEPTLEKQLLIRTLKDLRMQLNPFRRSLGPPWTFKTYQKSIEALKWFSKEAEAWQPRAAEEGKGLRKSFQLMLSAIRRVGNRSGPSIELMRAVSEDLSIKRDHCRSMGLSAEQRVEVKTKRLGLAEVNGLEVWYLEKFLATDPTATPHRFRQFSSPTSEMIVPGRYTFWAKNPASGKVGERVEHRIGVERPQPDPRRAVTLPIEVLAP